MITMNKDYFKIGDLIVYQYDSKGDLVDSKDFFVVTKIRNKIYIDVYDIQNGTFLEECYSAFFKKAKETSPTSRNSPCI